MANRTFDESRLALLKRMIDIYAVVDVAAEGAVTLMQWNFPSLGQASGVSRTYSAAPTTGGGNSFPSVFVQGDAGVYSVTRTAAGLWTIQLQDTYERLMGLSVHGALAGGLSAIVGIAENTTITDMAAQTPGSVVGIALLSATATALDPAADTRIYLHLQLSDASEP